MLYKFEETWMNSFESILKTTIIISKFAILNPELINFLRQSLLISLNLGNLPKTARITQINDLLNEVTQPRDTKSHTNRHTLNIQ